MNSCNDILREILYSRGIVEEDDLSEFLSEKPQRTYDPLLLHGMGDAVDLVKKEIDRGSRICVYGDYDADGVTSVCIMMKGLKYLTDNVFYYIPSRFSEGYGLNCTAIDRVLEKGADLMITVDCGCVSYDEVEYAKSKGLKVIVTDHHTIENVIADCIVVNPKHPDSKYPFKELAGCGVAFKFIQALQRSSDIPRSVFNDILDFAAIGTIGDIVSLQDENRTIVKYGLKALNSNCREAVKQLAGAASLGRLDSENIAFGIVPRINAAGRMESASDAVELFLSDKASEISEGVDKLMSYNKRRKSLQDEAYRRCLDMIEGDENFIMLKVEDVHEGIAGIVAGNLKEKFNRPVVIMTPSGDGSLKGTGRSIEGIDLYDVLNKSCDLFERFGGHKGACGFLIKEEKADRLIDNSVKAVNELIEADSGILNRKMEFDMVLDPEDVTLELMTELKKLEPCGEGNPIPAFCLENVHIQALSFMGGSGDHARFKAYKNGSCVECVLFRTAKDNVNLLNSQDTVDIIGKISLNAWKGQEKVQFIVEEIIGCK